MTNLPPVEALQREIELRFASGDTAAVTRDEFDALSRAIKDAGHRSFQDGRISYMGFSYGVGSQWGIDSLRSAIRSNKHD